MVRNKNVSLFRIQQLEAFHFHTHATQKQPPARAKERPRINQIVFIYQPGKQQNRRPTDREQRSRDKQRPPIMQTTHETCYLVNPVLHLTRPKDAQMTKRLSLIFFLIFFLSVSALAQSSIV